MLKKASLTPLAPRQSRQVVQEGRVAQVPDGVESSKVNRMSRPSSGKLAVNHSRVGELGCSRSEVGRTGWHWQQLTGEAQACSRRMFAAEDQQQAGQKQTQASRSDTAIWIRCRSIVRIWSVTDQRCRSKGSRQKQSQETSWGRCRQSSRSI